MAFQGGTVLTDIELANARIQQLEKKLGAVNSAFRRLTGVLMQMDVEGTLPNSIRVREAVGGVVMAFTQE